MRYIHTLILVIMLGQTIKSQEVPVNATHSSTYIESDGLYVSSVKDDNYKLTKFSKSGKSLSYEKKLKFKDLPFLYFTTNEIQITFKKTWKTGVVVLLDKEFKVIKETEFTKADMNGLLKDYEDRMSSYPVNSPYNEVDKTGIGISFKHTNKTSKLVFGKKDMSGFIMEFNKQHEIILKEVNNNWPNHKLIDAGSKIVFYVENMNGGLDALMLNHEESYLYVIDKEKNSLDFVHPIKFNNKAIHLIKPTFLFDSLKNTLIICGSYYDKDIVEANKIEWERTQGFSFYSLNLNTKESKNNIIKYGEIIDNSWKIDKMPYEINIDAIVKKGDNYEMLSTNYYFYYDSNNNTQQIPFKVRRPFTFSKITFTPSLVVNSKSLKQIMGYKNDKFYAISPTEYIDGNNKVNAFVGASSDFSNIVYFYNGEVIKLKNFDSYEHLKSVKSESSDDEPVISIYPKVWSSSFWLLEQHVEKAGIYWY